MLVVDRLDAIPHGVHTREVLLAFGVVAPALAKLDFERRGLAGDAMEEHPVVAVFDKGVFQSLGPEERGKPGVPI